MKKTENAKKNQSPVLFKDEINAFLKDLFYEDWMDENDWAMFLDALEIKSGVSIRSMSENLQVGLKNGYSIEQQFEIAKATLKNGK